MYIVKSIERDGKEVVKRVVGDKNKIYYNHMWDWNLDQIIKWYRFNSIKEYKEFFKK